MPRKQKKYHFIYKTTNLVNGKFYVGMHSTDNLGDGYFGSGKILNYSIKKHGVENHQVEILEFLPSREELKKREAEVVNEELLAHPLCMNLKFGGEGGGKIWNEAHSAVFHSAGAKVSNTQRTGKPLSDFQKTQCSTAIKAHFAENGHPWKGRHHSEETKEKMRKPKNVGENNAQFGKCWVNNGLIAKMVKKEELQSLLKLGWSKGRKIN